MSGLELIPARISSLPKPIPGNFYDVLTLIAASAQGTLLLTANRLYLMPIALGACTIDQLTIPVSTAVGASTARVGLYADPPIGGIFGVPLVDSGDVATATNGVKTATVAVPHPGGIIWIALLPSAAITVTSTTQTAQTFPLGQPASNTVTRYGGLYFDTSYGALPSNFTKTGYITTSGYPQSQARVA